MKYTKAHAKEILDLWKGETHFFDGTMTSWTLETQLRCAGLTQAAAISIVMALVMAGAKFKD